MDFTRADIEFARSWEDRGRPDLLDEMDARTPVLGSKALASATAATSIALAAFSPSAAAAEGAPNVVTVSVDSESAAIASPAMEPVSAERPATPAAASPVRFASEEAPKIVAGMQRTQAPVVTLPAQSIEPAEVIDAVPIGGVTESVPMQAIAAAEPAETTQPAAVRFSAPDTVETLTDFRLLTGSVVTPAAPEIEAPESEPAPAPAPPPPPAPKPQTIFPLVTTRDRVANYPETGARWCVADPEPCHHHYWAADIGDGTGTVVRAPFAGTILSVKYDDYPGDGENTVGSRIQMRVDLPGSPLDGGLAYLAHMQDDVDGRGIKVTEGQRVEAGTIIGELGDWADAVGTPPHLHLDILPADYDRRPSCSSESCMGLPFLNVQPLLIETFARLPENGAAPAPPPAPPLPPAPEAPREDTEPSDGLGHIRFDSSEAQNVHTLPGMRRARDSAIAPEPARFEEREETAPVLTSLRPLEPETEIAPVEPPVFTPEAPAPQEPPPAPEAPAPPAQGFEKDWARYIPVSPDGPYRTQADVDAFITAVDAMSQRLGFDTDHVLGGMNYETVRTFDPGIRNEGSGAAGLIQFTEVALPQVNARRAARGEAPLTLDGIAAMSPIEQLSPVEDYFASSAGQLRSLNDIYLRILWPAAVGKPDSHVTMTQGTRAYRLNSGLDLDDNGEITVAEITRRVNEAYDQIPNASAPAPPAEPAPPPMVPVEMPAGETASPTEEVRAFVGEYGDLADRVSAESGVPAEVILAVAAHESDFGHSDLTTEANNFFGIKAKGRTPWDGPTVTMPATEDRGNGTQEEEAEFRQYDSPEASFRDYARVLHSGLYDDAFEAETSEEFVQRLVDDNGARYALDPPNADENDEGYAAKVIRFIDQIQGLRQAQQA